MRFAVWKVRRIRSCTSSITFVNHGSMCPTIGAAMARYTRGSTQDGPGVSINRWGGSSSPGKSFRSVMSLFLRAAATDADGERWRPVPDASSVNNRLVGVNLQYVYGNDRRAQAAVESAGWRGSGQAGVRRQKKRGLELAHAARGFFESPIPLC